MILDAFRLAFLIGIVLATTWLVIYLSRDDDEW